MEAAAPMLASERPEAACQAARARPYPPRIAEVMHRRAEQRVLLRLRILVEREDMHLMPPRQPLHQAEKGGRHPFDPAAVEPARGYQPDLHRPAPGCRLPVVGCWLVVGRFPSTGN